MKKSYYIWTIIIVVVALGLLAIPYYFKNNSDEAVRGAEANKTPEELVEAYVRENISTLSPEKEVLGGKFYVTEFEAKNGNGIVSYEDGHVAFVANFTYEVDSLGKVSINSFVIRYAPGSEKFPSDADIMK